MAIDGVVSGVGKINASRLTGYNDNSFNTNMEKGETVSAKVIEKSEGSVILDLNGKIISAKSPSDSPLFAGMIAEFEVVENSGSEIVLRPLVLSTGELETKLEGLIKKELSELSLPLNDKNIRLLISMHGFNIPISKSNFVSLQSELFSVMKDLASVQNIVSDELNNLDIELSSLLDSLDSGAEEISANSKSAVSNTVSKDSLLFKEINPQKLEFALKNISDALMKDEKFKMPENMQRELLNLAGNPDKAIDTISFLKSNSVDINLKNIILANSFLKGDIGLTQALADTLESFFSKDEASIINDLNTVYSKESNSLNNDDKLIKSLVKFLSKTDSGEKSSQLARDIKQSVSEFGDAIKQLQNAKANMPLENAIKADAIKSFNSFNDPNSLLSAVVVPFLKSKGFDEVEMYVKRDKKGGSSQRQNTVIYISLNTKNIENVRVKIDDSKSSLNINFMCMDEAYKRAFDAEIKALQSNINFLINKSVNIDVAVLKSDISLVELQKQENLMKINAFGIDAKI